MSICEKKLLIYSAPIFIFLFICLFTLFPKKNTTIDISSYPTFGNKRAPFQFVIFEEFACLECQRFHAEDLPIIFKKYVNTGIAKVSLIPMAYLDLSEAPCQAALSMCLTQNQFYLPFLSFIFHNPNPWTSPVNIFLNFAYETLQFSPETSLKILKNAQIDSLINYGQSICDKIYEVDIHMPTIFINNQRLENISIKGIEEKLKEFNEI